MRFTLQSALFSLLVIRFAVALPLVAQHANAPPVERRRPATYAVVMVDGGSATQSTGTEPTATTVVHTEKVVSVTTTIVFATEPAGEIHVAPSATPAPAAPSESSSSTSTATTHTVDTTAKPTHAVPTHSHSPYLSSSYSAKPTASSNSSTSCSSTSYPPHSSAVSLSTGFTSPTSVTTTSASAAETHAEWKQHMRPPMRSLDMPWGNPAASGASNTPYTDISTISTHLTASSAGYHMPTQTPSTSGTIHASSLYY